MDYGKKTTEFFKLIMAQMQLTIDFREGDDRKELANVIWNRLFDIDGPRIVHKRPSAKAIFIANKLFRPLSEIMSSIETISNIEIYIRNPSYKRQGISRLNYLKYHIDNYLNELYLLKNRLIAYLTTLERAYKKSDNSAQVKSTLGPLHIIVSRALDGYIEMRGYHVHQNRYADDDLDRLTALALLSRSSDEFGIFMHSMFTAAYRDIKRKWAKNVKTGLKGLQKLLEHYFGNLLEVFSSKGKFLYPSNVRWT